MLTSLQYQLLKRMFPVTRGTESAVAPEAAALDGASKLTRHLGSQLIQQVQGKTVMDFGCGEGCEAVALARAGARRVIGVDIRPSILEIARRNAVAAGVQDICTFTTSPQSMADVIVSIDAFEHFADPLSILNAMNEVLSSSGKVVVSFGPTWYHPLGGHTFSVFPWAHLVFGEDALIRWRSDFKSDGAKKFSEVAGGLNQMTIRRFEEIVRSSSFEFEHFEAVPIRQFRRFHNRLSREFTTAVIRCSLVKRDER
ncbi:MAG: hypothetical protein JWP08_2845 [Bryobacterales bacterium]|nr:hypothetical protein [Bryobacterales bacterium]